MKDVVAYVVSSHGYSERRACAVTRQHRSTQRKVSRREPHTEIRQRMHEITSTRLRYGYRRIHIMLKREGWPRGRNLIYRLYREEGLVLRRKHPRRRKMVVHREARCKPNRPNRPNEAWSLDFVHDQLSNGQKFRMLTVVDIYNREALAIDVGSRLRGKMWWKFSIAWSGTEGRLAIYLRTMAGSSLGVLLIFEPTIMGSASTSAVQASQPTMPT